MYDTIKVLKWKKCIPIWLQDPYNLSPSLVFRIKWDWMMEANDQLYINLSVMVQNPAWGRKSAEIKEPLYSTAFRVEQTH